MSTTNGKVNLYIPVEIKNRELYSKVLLARIAAERGFNVLLGRKGELNELVGKSTPGVYYGLGTVKNFVPFYTDLVNKGNLLVVNDEEGLVTYSDKMYLDLKVSPETMSVIDILFAWGDVNQRVIASGRTEAASKLRITGNPRFDLLKDPYKRIYDPEVAMIRKQYGKYVLICTSFASCNHYIRELDYLQALIDKKVLTSEESITIYRRYQKLKYSAWQAFLKAIPMLAQMYPDINFVIRPHPSEYAGVYTELTKKFQNVFLKDEFSIHPWLLAAKAMVHHYCTSAVEAFAAGTPGFALRPERDPLIEKEIPYECSRDCKSPEELVGALSNLSLDGEQYALVNPVRDYTKYVRNLSNVVASELIIDEICNAVDTTQKEVSRKDKDTLVSRQNANHKFAGRLRSVVAFFLPSRRANQRYISHKFNRLTKSEVQRVLRVFAPDKANSLNCKQVGNNIVLICTKQLN